MTKKQKQTTNKPTQEEWNNAKCYYPNCEAPVYLYREIYRGDAEIPTHGYFLCKEHSKP